MLSSQGLGLRGGTLYEPAGKAAPPHMSSLSSLLSYHCYSSIRGTVVSSMVISLGSLCQRENYGLFLELGLGQG